MNNKINKLAIAFALIFEIIILTSAQDNLMLSLTAALGIVIPFFITYLCNRKKITLPASFQLILMIFMFLAQYLGEIKNFYDMIWWWDLMLHAIFGSYIVKTAFSFSGNLFMKNPVITRKRFALFKSLFALCFSITLGTLWEIFEFSGDYIFNSQMVKGGIEDTATDLMMNFIFALITASIYYFKNKDSK